MIHAHCIGAVMVEIQHVCRTRHCRLCRVMVKEVAEPVAMTQPIRFPHHWF